jgi:hypothetical protein
MMGADLQRHVRTGAWAYVYASLEPLPRVLPELGCPELAAILIGVCRQQSEADLISARHGYSDLTTELGHRLGPAQLADLLEEGRNTTVADAARHVIEVIDDLLAGDETSP